MTSSINPIPAATATQAVGQAHHHHRHGMRKAGMDAAAQALGMSAGDLQSALGSGQTLASLAQSKGVSTSSLASAISSALTSANQSLDPTRAQQIAQRMINGPTSSTTS